MYKIEKCDVRAELLFCVLNLLLFCHSRCRRRCRSTISRDFKNRQRGGLENARTESGAGASTAY